MAQSTSIKLRDGLKDRVKAVAEMRQRSPNHIMNDAINDYVERAERRAALRTELEEAHREYVASGRLHLTHEEVVEWMAKRRADRNAPMPKLHK